jgi:hypothetical protein
LSEDSNLLIFLHEAHDTANALCFGQLHLIALWKDKGQFLIHLVLSCLPLPPSHLVEQGEGLIMTIVKGPALLLSLLGRGVAVGLLQGGLGPTGELHIDG